ncbi:hypothetical protein ACQJBY_030636 [Aegilops geniculata]
MDQLVAMSPCGNRVYSWMGVLSGGSGVRQRQEDERNGNLEDNNWWKSSQCYLLFANGWRGLAGVLLDGDVAWWQQGVLLDGGAIQWQWGAQRTLKGKVGEWKIPKWEYPKKMSGGVNEPGLSSKGCLSPYKG